MSVNAGRQSIPVVKPKPSESKFSVGEVIPVSGVYRVFHSIHRVSHDVTLLKNEKFPPCRQCADKVYFELVREVPEIDENYEFKVRLFQIPHPKEEQDEAAEETA